MGKAKRASGAKRAVGLRVVLQSPIMHYRHVLGQLGYSPHAIRTLERVCSKPGFCSGYYKAANYSLPFKAKNEITIKELLVEIANFKQACASGNPRNIARSAYAVGLMQGALFQLNGGLTDSQGFATETAKKKRRMAREILELAEWTRKEMIETDGEAPKTEALYRAVMQQRRSQRRPTRSLSWFYANIKFSS